MAEKKSTSIWIWLLLVLILTSFAAFILFLDQKIVSRSDDTTSSKQPVDQSTKPTIDFYSILPERELEITISEEEQAAIANPSINKEASDQSILQVGSFQSNGEADSLKAQLAFLGLEAKIKSAVVDADTWYRVQLGPFGSNTRLSQAKNLLIENNITFIERKSVN